MGDPKFSRKRFERPPHPWKADRIASENTIVKKYGLKNKKEIWRAQSYLRQIRGQSRVLQARVRTGSEQAKRETDALLRRLARLGLIPDENTTLNDVLALDLDMILKRRLQTLVYLKGLAKTPTQARQFVVHGHTAIGGRKVTIPGYLVTKAEEQEITFFQRSPIASDLHPARQQEDEKGAPKRVEPEMAPAPEAPKEEKPAAAPAEKPKEAPADKPKEEKPKAAPSEKPKDAPAKKADAAPAKEAAKAPAKKKEGDK